MIDQDRLVEFAESYLKSLISEASGAVGTDFDSFAPFGELGIDSFRVLKIVKALEADFGTLPKTLLFENFNINDLARYFVDKHAETLSAKFAAAPAPAPAPAAAGLAKPLAKSVAPPIDTAAPPVAAQAAPLHAGPLQAGPILILEKDAHAHPELGKLVKDIFDRYKNDGSVSRGTRNIAPNLFIGSERKGYFHYARSKNVIVAYTYTGPVEYFPAVARELHQHCDRLGFELNLLAADALTAIGGARFSSTPFGVLQRVLNLQNFTLEGQAMRRLRYQVSKFEKAGVCRTEEFRCGTDPETSRKIAEMIDLWCAGRTMVNPLIHIVKDEILAGTLNPEHRIFLSYVDDVLQNVILISPLSAEMNGYLMDLEFYHKGMPLGGLEFTIINIIRTLVAEGCDVLSLGGTYGCKLEESANADPEVDKILDELRMQNIFNDEGNLQFKNKFRPENKTIYLCRPAGKGNPHNVIDVIMMIADPMKMQTSDEENHNVGKPAAHGAPAAQGGAVMTVAPAGAAAAGPIVGIEGEARSFVLAASGFNPLNIPHEHVEFDLKTDSWAQLEMPAIENQMGHLHARLQQPANLEQALRGIFPFAHFALTASGRTAEGVFYRAWPRKGVVPQNLLFPTTIFHQIDKGFSPRELPHPEVFKLDSKEAYKGNLDLAALQEQLERDAAAVSMVCIEISNNAAGGHPVSIEHLKQVKSLLAGHAIPLVIDGTRVLENARFLIENEREYAGRSVWQVAREILGHADAVVVSLAKDFCVTGGGLIATNDAAFARTLQDMIREEGCGLGAIDKKLLALSLQDRNYLETQTLRRQESVRHLWNVLVQRGIPVAQPAGAHCVLIDVKRIPEFQGLRHPVASFVAWLYLNTGIRAGAHNAGMQKDSAINGLIRLAVPIGLKRQQIDDIAERMVAAFADKRNIPDIDTVGNAAESLGDIHAKYKLVQYHRPSAAPVAQASAQAAAPAPSARADAKVDARQASAVQAPARSAAPASRDIAIVGMAGRYPKANNLADLWDKLLQGADCIDEIPEARLAERRHNDFTKRYRGGFIDDVDKFDARFFGISSRDAQIMDPQERLFLEVAHEAIEDAGYYPEALGRDDAARNIGVFVGAVWSSYQMLGVEEKIAGNNINPSSFLWSIANRVSYWMNLSGPSLTLDTACSASLTAIKLACDAINSGECAAAIAGGVNLDLHQSKFDINSTGGSLSKDGICRSYGKGANGYVSGEGVGALFLKPLAQAIADGDQIHGVIKSAVVTHSGRTSAYTIPNPRTQTGLIAKALEQGGIDARTIGYIEGHGTGTDLGDSIEISGLVNAFAKYGVENQSCAIGSIKTNIGHLEAASGIVGVQKILLQMKHRRLVPSLHSSELNDNIDFKNSPFYVQQQAQEWRAKEVDGVRFPRRAAISAIGIGGANAHIILEEYAPADPPQADADAAAVDRIFPLSARTEEQLKAAAVRLRDFLQRELASASSAPARESDIAYTLAFGRKSFDYRLAVVAKTKEELLAKLTSFVEGKPDADVMAGHVANANAVTALLNAREKQDFVNLLVQSREPRRLAQLWSDGVIADWQGVDLGQRGRRISLPTYPFAKERHWIVDRKPAALPPAVIPLGDEPKSAARDDARAAAAEARPGPARRMEKYHFSAAGEHGGNPDGGLNLDAAEKARLFVRQMFADQIRVPVDDVNDDLYLMETGVTSMDMAEMTQALKERIDPAFSPTAFFECMTLGSFAHLLVRKYEPVFQKMIVAKRVVEDADTVKQPRKKEAPQEDSGDASGKSPHLLDAESELALPDPKSVQPVHEGKARFVLLTGATGFLGIHALAEFVNADPEVRVLCLVRAPDKKQGMRRILKQADKYELSFDERRISVLCGDINRPRLGLTEKEWERCSREVDQILHASAHVNHIEGYATFRESTHGMKEVIRLAGSQRLKLIQFISSTAACFHKNGDEFSVFEKEAFIENGESVYGGYGQSKWVQETFLKRAHEHGIPYVIYRFGELSGSSRTGLGQTDDMLHRLLQMRLAIGCREKISSDVLDMVPVDAAARLIVGAGNAPALWNKILHATHLKPYGFANLYRRAESCGLQFAPVTREQYLAKCYDFVQYIYSINPVGGFVLECVLRDAEGSVRKRKIMDGYFAVLFPFAQDNFKRALQTLGFALPDWKSLLDQYFSRWSRDDCGFMSTIYAYRNWTRLEEKQKVASTAAAKDTAASQKTAQDESMLENVSET
ncbi:MAG TPA: thioester reductase domain-containing protein [Paucimonas sp.]|nr:thioester reductase domain-containing protein [Paucimonas sp.]